MEVRCQDRHQKSAIRGRLSTRPSSKHRSQTDNIGDVHSIGYPCRRRDCHSLTWLADQVGGMNDKQSKEGRVIGMPILLGWDLLITSLKAYWRHRNVDRFCRTGGSTVAAGSTNRVDGAATPLRRVRLYLFVSYQYFLDTSFSLFVQRTAGMGVGCHYYNWLMWTLYVTFLYVNLGCYVITVPHVPWTYFWWWCKVLYIYINFYYY